MFLLSVHFGICRLLFVKTQFNETLHINEGDGDKQHQGSTRGLPCVCVCSSAPPPGMFKQIQTCTSQSHKGTGGRGGFYI